MQDTEDATLQLALQSQAKVWIVPAGLVHGKAHTFERAFAVAMKSMVSIVGDLRLEESKAAIKEEHG